MYVYIIHIYIYYYMHIYIHTQTHTHTHIGRAPSRCVCPAETELSRLPSPQVCEYQTLGFFCSLIGVFKGLFCLYIRSLLLLDRSIFRSLSTFTFCTPQLRASSDSGRIFVGLFPALIRSHFTLVRTSASSKQR
jgi:hypothetical protein